MRLHPVAKTVDQPMAGNGQFDGRTGCGGADDNMLRGIELDDLVAALELPIGQRAAGKAGEDAAMGEDIVRHQRRAMGSQIGRGSAERTLLLARGR